MLRSTLRARFLAAVVIGVAGASAVVLASRADAWFTAAAAGLVTVTLVMGLNSKPMQLAFVVGHGEAHQVIFRFNKFCGNLSLAVDGEPVVRKLPVFHTKLTSTYQIVVDGHDVRIEKKHALFLGGFRAQLVRAYIDDVLVAQGVA